MRSPYPARAHLKRLVRSRAARPLGSIPFNFAQEDHGAWADSQHHGQTAHDVRAVVVAAGRMVNTVAPSSHAAALKPGELGNDETHQLAT